MFDINDPRQIAMFPELSKTTSLPSIATQPEFETALNNLVRISDMGAFVQLNISGIEKSYTLSIDELGIPADFLRLGAPFTPLTVYLFPPEVRRQLQKLVYDIKAYFNSDNSLMTTFGPFLYRQKFEHWHKFLELERSRLCRTIRHLLGKKTYSRYFIELFERGLLSFQAAADITAPWEYEQRLTMSTTHAMRKRLDHKEFDQHTLSPTDIEYPLKMMILKTRHIPLKLDAYLKQIQVVSFFKTIHLEHLAEVEINTLDDIKHLVDQF